MDQNFAGSVRSASNFNTALKYIYLFAFQSIINSACNTVIKCLLRYECPFFKFIVKTVHQVLQITVVILKNETSFTMAVARFGQYNSLRFEFFRCVITKAGKFMRTQPFHMQFYESELFIIVYLNTKTQKL